jgi:hypothetical protein
MWHYYDNDGQKQGPYSDVQLRGFAKQGTITPETRIENEDGKSVLARKVKGLTFSEAAPSVEVETYGVTSSPPPPPVEVNPFAAPPPVEVNPFTAPKPVEVNPFTTSLPQSVPTPVPKEENKGAFGKTIVGILKTIVVVVILSVIGGTVLPIVLEYKNRSDVAKELVKEELSSTPLEITDISVNWTTKPTVFEVVTAFWGSFLNKITDSADTVAASASGQFTVKAKTTEKLYKSVGNEDGLRELGVANLREKEFNDAMEKHRKLPTTQQNDLRDATPQDQSSFRFYKILIPGAEEVIVTGSIDLAKEGNEAWRKNNVRRDPFSFGNDFASESKLQGASKLDDPKTKENVQKIIQQRKDFIAKVDEVYGKWTFNEAEKSGLDRVVGDKPLKITAGSVDWKDKTMSSASGKFTVKTKTTEKFYQSVDRKKGLEKLAIPKLYEEKAKELGIADIYEKEIAEGDLLKQFEFYEVLLSSGSDVTLTGTIKLANSESGDWRVADIQADPLPITDNFVRDSQLRNACKLDDPDAKRKVETHIKNFIDFLTALIKQKDDFDKFCRSGMEYEGNFRYKEATGGIRVVFESNEKNTAKGTMTISFFNAKVPRRFIVEVNTEKTTIYPVTGRFEALVPRPAREFGLTGNEAGIKDAFEVVMANEVNIQFTDEIKFSLVVNGQIIPLKLSRVGDGDTKQNTTTTDRNWIKPAIKNWER